MKKFLKFSAVTGTKADLEAGQVVKNIVIPLPATAEQRDKAVTDFLNAVEKYSAREQKALDAASSD